MKHLSLLAISAFATMAMILSCGETAEEDSGNGSAAEHVPESEVAVLPTPEVELTQAGHILISTESPVAGDTLEVVPDAASLAENIRETIVSGDATFEEMALEHSHCWTAARGGLLPAFTRGGLSEEMEEAIIDLQPGEISDVVRTRFGYHIFTRVI